MFPFSQQFVKDDLTRQRLEKTSEVVTPSSLHLQSSLNEFLIPAALLTAHSFAHQGSVLPKEGDSALTDIFNHLVGWHMSVLIICYFVSVLDTKDKLQCGPRTGIKNSFALREAFVLLQSTT